MTDSQNPLRVLYMGTPDFAVSPLNALIEHPEYDVAAVITQPDKPAGRGKKLSAPPVKKRALDHDLPLYQPGRLKKEWSDFKEKLDTHAPYDVGVVCAFGQILPKEVLDYPKFGCINIHASLLPRWRGAAPIQRAIMSGDSKTGITLMQMDEGLDTGDWYVMEEVAITSDMTAQNLHDALAHIGSDSLTKHLSAICRGERERTQQPEEGITYAEKITKSEAKIQWDQKASVVSQHIRGLSPFPGAFTILNGKRLKIYSAQEVSPMKGKEVGRPGTIYHFDDTRLEICCKDGVVSLDDLQLEGKSRLKVKDFVRGQSFTEDSHFSGA